MAFIQALWETSVGVTREWMSVCVTFKGHEARKYIFEILPDMLSMIAHY